LDLSLLQKAIDYGQGEFLLEDVVRFIEQGKMQLMELPENTLVVTEIVRYPRKSRLRVVLVAGRLTEQSIDAIGTYARAYGLDGVEGSGREGWGKVLEPKGFIKAYTTFINDF
jgi:hypothetical protein